MGLSGLWAGWAGCSPLYCIRNKYTQLHKKSLLASGKVAEETGRSNVRHNRPHVRHVLHVFQTHAWNIFLDTRLLLIASNFILFFIFSSSFFSFYHHHLRAIRGYNSRVSWRNEKTADVFSWPSQLCVRILKVAIEHTVELGQCCGLFTQSKNCGVTIVGRY
jgi:hypothetical protein